MNMKSFMTGKFLLILIKSNVREATLTKIITKMITTKIR